MIDFKQSPEMPNTVQVWPSQGAPYWVNSVIGSDLGPIAWRLGGPEDEQLISGRQVVVPCSQNVVNFAPFERGSGAFQEFADAHTTKQSVINFVNRYGCPVDTSFNRALALPSAMRMVEVNYQTTIWVDIFEKLSVAMDEARSEWENAKLSGDYSKLSKIFYWETVASPTYEAIEIEPTDPRPAQFGLNLVIDKEENPYPQMKFSPRDLHSALWFQFATAVTENLNIKQCEYCSTWFAVGPKTGKSSKARFCSNRCRVAAHRLAKKLNG